MTSSSPMGAAQPTALGLLRGNPRFRRLGLAILVSSLGDPLSLTISLVLLFGAYGPLGVGGAYASRMVGSLLVGGVIGSLTDRVDRRRLVVALEAGRFGLLLAMPALTHLSLASIFPCLLLLGGAESLVQPARQAALPEIVGKRRIEIANALLLTALSVAQAGGYALGGLLIARLPDPRVLYVGDAASFAASGLLVLSLGSIGGGVATARLRAGITDALQVPRARSLLVLAGVVSVLIGMGIPAILPVSYQLSTSGPIAFTVMEACLIVGIVAGSVVAGRVPAQRVIQVMVVALGVFAAGCLGLTASPTLAPAVVAIAVSGAGNAIYSVANNSALLRVAAASKRGTVMAARFSLTQGGNIVGLGLGALVTAAWGPRAVFLVVGIGLLLIGAEATVARLWRQSSLTRAGAEGQAPPELRPPLGP